jgi:hypothetical protein
MAPDSAPIAATPAASVAGLHRKMWQTRRNRQQIPDSHGHMILGGLLQQQLDNHNCDVCHIVDQLSASQNLLTEGCRNYVGRSGFACNGALAPMRCIVSMERRAKQIQSDGRWCSTIMSCVTSRLWTSSKTSVTSSQEISGSQPFPEPRRARGRSAGLRSGELTACGS